MSEKYERRATVAYDPGRRPVDGITVAVKFPPAIFQKLTQARAMSGLSSVKDVIRVALDKHVETLRLVQEGYRIFAAPEDFRAGNTVPITPEWQAADSSDLSRETVITEMKLGLGPEELRFIDEIQDLLGLGQSDISTPVLQSVLAYFWMLDRQQKGYPSIHAVKEAPPRCAELRFDRESLRIVGG